MESKIYECIVIGAGIMGSTTAYYLSQKYGNYVCLIEQFDLVNRNGSSHGDSRIIRKTYPEEHYTNLMTESYQLWKSAENESKTVVFTQTGGISLGHKNNKDLQKLIEASHKYGNYIQVLNPTEILRKFPTLTLPPDFIGVFSPESGILNPNKSVSMFQNLARANACEILEKTKITDLKVDFNGLVLIECTGGKILRCKKCVVTCGAWSGDIWDKLNENLAKPNRFKLPLNPIQTTVSYFKVEKNPELYSYEKFPVFINYEEPVIYGTPVLEYPNMIKVAAHFGVDCHPDKRDYQADFGTIEKVVSPFIKTFFQGVDPKPKLNETCLYTVTPDDDFIIDSVPNCPNILIGTGFSGHGFKLAPIVGKILADWTINGRNPIPNYAHVFSINRFNDKITSSTSKL